MDDAPALSEDFRVDLKGTAGIRREVRMENGTRIRDIRMTVVVLVEEVAGRMRALNIYLLTIARRIRDGCA